MHWSLWGVSHLCLAENVNCNEILGLVAGQDYIEFIDQLSEFKGVLVSKYKIHFASRVVLILLKLYWAPDFVEFMPGRFSHFNITIAYSNSNFCGTWTPRFCKFTSNFSKTSTPQSVVQLPRKTRMLTLLRVYLFVFVICHDVQNSSSHSQVLCVSTMCYYCRVITKNMWQCYFRRVFVYSENYKRHTSSVVC